jgi:hypothetical protein
MEELWKFAGMRGKKENATRHLRQEGTHLLRDETI